MHREMQTHRLGLILAKSPYKKDKAEKWDINAGKDSEYRNLF